MFLSIKNVGKISHAEIEIAGITVIAGENNTGKSTLGEVLFSVFNCFHNPDELTRKAKVDNISDILRQLKYISMNEQTAVLRSFHPEKTAQALINEFTDLNYDSQDIRAFLVNYLVKDNRKGFNPSPVFLEDITSISNRIYDRLSVSDDELFRFVLNSALDDEFNGQINNIFTNDTAEIKLTIRDKVSEIFIVDNEVKDIDGVLHLNTEAVYLDDPFVLDNVFSPIFSRMSGHREKMHLLIRRTMRKSRSSAHALDYIVVSRKLEKIYKVLDEVCDGKIVQGGSPREGGYLIPGSDKPLDVRNLSSGMKTFVIIKQLLQNGVIEENGTLILDEPEIHLHPAWQILFAELIAMLQKEFGLHVLMTTHSPYFLNAIQVYAKKYDIADNCKYYQAVDRGRLAVVEDVSNEVERIYRKLAGPFQQLENEVYRVD